MSRTKLFSTALLAAAAWLAGGSAQALEQDANGYYLIGSKADLLAWTEISGYEATNAKLTDNVDDVDFMLCTNSASFEGIFDGQGHTITLNIDTNKEHGGLFYNMKGTVKNLVVGGKFVARNKNCGIVAGYSWSSATKFENVVSIAEMEVEWTANASNGGLLGITKYNVNFRNCVSAVKITGNQGFNHGFVGWMSGGVASINNCISIIDVSGTAANSSESFGNHATSGRFSISNSYSVKTSADQDTPFSSWSYTTTEKIASGEIAYLINQAAGSNVFFQNLDTDADAYPVPFDTHAVVYANGQANCDGSPKEGSVITYSNTDGLVQDAHVVEDGFCTVCHNVIADYITPVDGVYPLATAKDMVWFAAVVNNVVGKNEARAKLTADIDFTGVAYTPIGNSYDHFFNGIFDGQGHRISNLVVETDATTPLGLFGVVGNKAVLKNIFVDESCSLKGAGYVAGIAASGKKTDGTNFQVLNCVNAATVESTGSKASGIYAQDPAGQNSQAAFVIDNCVNAGNITAPGGGNIAASFCGWVNTNLCSIYNSFNIGTITNPQANNVMFQGKNRFMNNSYDLVYGTDDSQQGYLAWGTTEPATNGELAAQMGCNFYQNLVNDAYPFPFYAEGRSRWNKITAVGYSTFYAKENIIIPAGVKAYTGKINGERLTLKAIEGDIIPAETPVVLEGNEGIYEMKVTTDDGSVIADNDLQASEETINPDGTQYCLAKHEDAVGFYKVAVGQSGKWNYMIAPGKAFLVVPASSEVKGFTFEMDDATGINAIDNGELTIDNAAIFNLSGQRISKAQKGVNIIGNKKILK